MPVHLWLHLSAAYCWTVLMPSYSFPLCRLFQVSSTSSSTLRPNPLKHSVDQLLHEIIFVRFMGCVEKAIVCTANCVSLFCVSPRFRDIFGLVNFVIRSLLKKFRGLPAQPDCKEVWPPHGGSTWSSRPSVFRCFCPLWANAFSCRGRAVMCGNFITKRGKLLRKLQICYKYLSTVHFSWTWDCWQGY